MIITERKKLDEILKVIGNKKNIFLIGCGECSATCKTGGESEILAIKQELESNGKTITGYCIPDSPCISSQIVSNFAKNKKAIEASDMILVLACGLGAQSVKENSRFKKPVKIGCNTLFMGALDKKGNFYELCSACGECVLSDTETICPVTRCPKGLLNGPCGGVMNGKCEVDKERDCVWSLIYEDLKNQGNLDYLTEIQKPKDYYKQVKPHKLIMSEKK
ncbi:MAG: 5,10-methylenetetrahydrofolate reductase [Candidatus Omnitrophica bacterium]|nr:5,10-methylenetetrahydrofolate reductase [Candidatus Omnitrophota bacterium]